MKFITVNAPLDSDDDFMKHCLWFEACLKQIEKTEARRPVAVLLNPKNMVGMIKPLYARVSFRGPDAEAAYREHDRLCSLGGDMQKCSSYAVHQNCAVFVVPDDPAVLETAPST